jgi:hypothetical protein
MDDGVDDAVAAGEVGKAGHGAQQVYEGVTFPDAVVVRRVAIKAGRRQG